MMQRLTDEDNPRTTLLLNGDGRAVGLFGACEDQQLQVTQLMRATFLAVQEKPGT